MFQCTYLKINISDFTSVCPSVHTSHLFLMLTSLGYNFNFHPFLLKNIKWQSWQKHQRHQSRTDTYLFLKFLPGEHCQFVTENFLRIEHLLVVHLLNKRVVLNAIGLKKLHVGHLKGLTDRLSDELSLEICRIFTPFPPTFCIFSQFVFVGSILILRISTCTFLNKANFQHFFVFEISQILVTPA